MGPALTQMTSWVKDWFYNPGCIDTPEKKRSMCFCAAVELIGLSMSRRASKEDTRVTHEILTYLLLGWNPITAWPDPSDYDEPTEETISNWDDIRDNLKGLMNFVDAERKVNLYVLVANLVRLCDEYGSTSTNLFIGERVTNLILALWLLDTGTSTPKDVFVIRACLDLYYRHKQSAPGLLDHEYASTNHEIKYCSWIKDQVNRLLKLNTSNDEFRRQVAYLGWFVSLVRASRITATVHRCDSWKAELAVALEEEVKLMQDTLNNRPLKFEDEDRNGSILNRSARLFKLFRLRPPPVKIR